MDSHTVRCRWKLVDRKFQFGIALRLLFALILLAIAGLAVMFAPSILALWTRNDPNLIEEAASEFLVLHRRIWPAALFCFVGLFAYCIFLSRRIAGPIYRINTVLEQLLRDEKPGPVSFRKNDFFHTTAQLIDRLVAKRQSARQGDGKTGEDGTP